MSDHVPPLFGFFGKMPAIGDFVSRGLAREQVKAIDDWLQAGLLALDAASPSWLQAYLVTPVWQFVLPRGQWADAALCGSVMPSVDRVGRYFPLVASAALDTLDGLPATLSRLATDLPAALQPELEPDALLARLQRCDAESAAASLPLLHQFNPHGDRSLWWSTRSGDAPFREITHRGKPDADLFLRLFGF